MKNILILISLLSGNLFADVLKLPAQDAVTKEGPVVPKIFVDKEGDKITVLDTEARSKINAAKNIKATNVYDDEANIEKYKKDYEQKALTDKNVKYAEYEVVAGDSLKAISQKLYGTTKKWKEIQVLNEVKLKNTTIQPGMKLKYVVQENPEVKPEVKPEVNPEAKVEDKKD